MVEWSRRLTFGLGDPGLQGLVKFLNVHSWGQSNVKSDQKLRGDNVRLDASVDLGQVQRGHIAKFEARALAMQSVEQTNEISFQL